MSRSGVSYTRDLADAVAEALNAHSFSLPFVSEVVYVPDERLKDLNALHVQIVCRDLILGQADRGRNDWQPGINICVLQHVSGVTDAVVGPLVDLVEDIADFLTRRSVGADGQWLWRETTTLDPLYHWEHLREWRQFTSVIRVDYSQFISVAQRQ